MKVVRLGELASGQGQYGTALPSRGWREGDPRYIRITDIREDGSLKPTLVAPDGDRVDWEKALLREDDLVFARSGATVGKTYIHGGDSSPAVYAGYLIRFSIDHNRALPRYVYHYTRTQAYRSWVDSTQRAVAQPNINAKQYANLPIPLPPLHEQQRIIAVLDHVDGIRMGAAKGTKEIDQLEQAIFVEMFGEPISNPHGYALERLGVVGTLDRGVSKHRPRNDPSLLGGPYPLIQTGDVARSGGTISSYSATYSELGLAQSKMWPSGTLCITIAANIAQTGILEFDACFPDSVVGFTADESTTAYVRTWFTFLQATLEAAAPQSAQRNINLASLRDLPVPLPPVADRKQFHECLRKVQEIRAVTVRRRQQLDELTASLHARVFSGQL